MEAPTAGHAKDGPQMRSYYQAVVALVFGLSMWWYFEWVLIPYQVADAASHGRPRGNLSDLYPRWYGTRALLLEGRDPYSAEVTREIQKGFYGRVLDPTRPTDPKDEQRFAYPLYVIFLLAPTIHWPFPAVQRGVSIVLCCLSVVSVFFWFAVLRWRLSVPTAATASVLFFGALPFVQGIKLDQLTLAVSCFIAAGMAALTAGFPMVAGLLLAVATVKPHLVALLISGLLFWSLNNRAEGSRLLLGFFLALFVLIGGAYLAHPGWVREFLLGLRAYQRYTVNESILEIFAGKTLGAFVSGIVVLLTARAWWLLRNHEVGSTGFQTAIALTLSATVVVIPTIATYNEVLLLPGILLLLRDWQWMRLKTRLAGAAYGLLASAVCWPWLAAMGLAASSFVLPAAAVQQKYALPFFASFALPSIAFIILVLYLEKLVAVPKDAHGGQHA
jgi:hypothetical protein